MSNTLKLSNKDTIIKSQQKTVNLNYANKAKSRAPSSKDLIGVVVNNSNLKQMTGSFVTNSNTNNTNNSNISKDIGVNSKDEKSKNAVIKNLRNDIKKFGTSKNTTITNKLRESNDIKNKNVTPEKKVSFITNITKNHPLKKSVAEKINDNLSHYDNHNSLCSESLFSKNSSYWKCDTDQTQYGGISSTFKKDFESISKQFKELTTLLGKYDIRNKNELNNIKECSLIVSTLDSLVLNANLLQIHCMKEAKAAKVNNESIYRRSVIYNQERKELDISSDFGAGLFKKETPTNADTEISNKETQYSADKEILETQLKAEEQYIKSSSENRVSTYKQLFKKIKESIGTFVEIFNSCIEKKKHTTNQFNVNFNFNVTEIKYLAQEKNKSIVITKDNNLEIKSSHNTGNIHLTCKSNNNQEYSEEGRSIDNVDSICSPNKSKNDLKDSKNFNIISSSFVINPVTNKFSKTHANLFKQESFSHNSIIGRKSDLQVSKEERLEVDKKMSSLTYDYSNTSEIVQSKICPNSSKKDTEKIVKNEEKTKNDKNNNNKEYSESYEESDESSDEEEAEDRNNVSSCKSEKSEKTDKSDESENDKPKGIHRSNTLNNLSKLKSENNKYFTEYEIEENVEGELERFDSAALSVDEDLPDTQENVPIVSLPRLKTKKVMPLKALLKKETTKKFNKKTSKAKYNTMIPEYSKKKIPVNNVKNANVKPKRVIYVETLKDNTGKEVKAQYELFNINEDVSPKSGKGKLRATKKSSMQSSSLQPKIICSDANFLEDDDN